jgi:pyrroline-5-carboxylate reductase
MILAAKRIGLIGGGAMAEALAGGLIAGGVPADHVRIAEPRPERRDQLSDQLGVATLEHNTDVVRDSDVVVLAVKPDVVAVALAALRAGDVDLSKPLWVSIAAGVRIDSIESRLPDGARIVRAMPNTPALVRTGATAICGNAHTDASDLAVASALFETVGTVWDAGREELLDAVTGLSGSGPAYAFLFLEALIDAGERVGLPREAAEQLALQTVHGAVVLAIESDRSPAELREQVSSPGGTTVAGLAELDAGEFRETVARAVAAATRRSVELGKDP